MGRAAQLQSIVLARYPDRFDWRSASGIAYLAFLAYPALTGVRVRLEPGAQQRHHRAQGSRGGRPAIAAARMALVQRVASMDTGQTK